MMKNKDKKDIIFKIDDPNLYNIKRDLVELTSVKRFLEISPATDQVVLKKEDLDIKDKDLRTIPINEIESLYQVYYKVRHKHLEMQENNKGKKNTQYLSEKIKYAWDKIKGAMAA